MVVVDKKADQTVQIDQFFPGEILPGKGCGRLPVFLHKMGISQPVMIDLSQKRYKGIALLHGERFGKVLHPKQWEQYGHFSTYTLDNRGNIYLIPTPFISIHPTTFTLQKYLYKLDSFTGKLSIFMTFDDVHPNANNPYGLNAIAWDCEDHSLWVAAIDESDYSIARGIVYHIDPVHKKIIQQLEGFDASTLRIVHTRNGKYLFAGSARDSGLYAYRIVANRAESSPHKILNIPDPNEHIRKIKVAAMNHLELETIPFSYSLIAQSSRQDRTHYSAIWRQNKAKWQITKHK